MKRFLVVFTLYVTSFTKLQCAVNINSSPQLPAKNASGRSRPSDEGGGAGRGGHPDPEISGGPRSPKKKKFGPSDLILVEK